MAVDRCAAVDRYAAAVGSVMVPSGVRVATPDAEIPSAAQVRSEVPGETPDVEVLRAAQARNEVTLVEGSLRVVQVRTSVILNEVRSVVGVARGEEFLRVGDLIVGFHSVARIGFQFPAARRHVLDVVRFPDSAFLPNPNPPQDEQPLPTVAPYSSAQHSAHY